MPSRILFYPKIAERLWRNYGESIIEKNKSNCGNIFWGEVYNDVKDIDGIVITPQLGLSYEKYCKRGLNIIIIFHNNTTMSHYSYLFWLPL